MNKPIIVGLPPEYACIDGLDDRVDSEDNTIILG